VTGLYEIETERLLLRQWRDGDWQALHRTYGDQEVMGWIGATAVDVAGTAAAVGRMSMHWRLLGYGMFALEERSSGELLGRVGLMLHPDWPLGGPRSRSDGRCSAPPGAAATPPRARGPALRSGSASWGFR